MDSEKYNRSVSLLCPTCGCSQFETSGGVDETVEMTKCTSCGRVATKDDLMRDNTENISEHVQEIGAEITKDFAAELRKSLKGALSGNKFIKFK